MSNAINPLKVKERREALGFSQTKLANLLNISQQMVAKIEKGEVAATSHIFSLSRLLGTTAEYLTDQTDDPDLGAVPRPTPTIIAEQLDAVTISEIDLKFGMGGGAYFDAPVEATQIVFSRSWISNFTNAPPEKLFFARGMGDSMAPTIHDGDIVLIDTSQKNPKMNDQIWAITQYGAGMIKRLRASSEGYKILSDNQNVPPDYASDGEMHVIGRVIAIVRRV